MPTRKTRVSNRAKKQKSTLKWWMAAVGIAIIVVVGIVVLRFSNAAEPGLVTAVYKGKDIGGWDLYAQYSAGRLLPAGKYQNLGNGYVWSVDTVKSATRCYYLEPGPKAGQVNMRESFSREKCGDNWYWNQPTWQWPVDTGALTQCWGNDALEGVPITNPSWANPAAKHPGIDIGVGVGTPIIAVDGGKIEAYYNESQTGGYGKLLILHTNSALWYAGYAHLNDFLDANGHQLPVGTIVQKGWVIGHSGNTGGVPAHLHFMVQNVPNITNGNDVPIRNKNPLNYFINNDGHNIGQCVRTSG